MPSSDPATKTKCSACETVTAALERRFEVFTLEARFAVRRPHQVVGNLASWYDGVKNNQDCVMQVNLNDPFFQHREVRFILDLEAQDIFEDVVNYVTVNVKKKRETGRRSATNQR